LYRRYGSGGGAPVEEIETHHLFEGEQRVLLVDDVITASDAAHPRSDGVTVRSQTLFRYQYGNLLGSACLELDDTAEVIAYEEYHPYGSTAHHAVNSTVEAPPKRYRYAGMERDEESGLSYHRARYCALWLTRWCSSDPQLPQNASTRYSYSSDSPVTRFDRYGEADQTRVGEIGELGLQQTLDDAFPGRFFVFLDPEKNVSATGFDLFAYDRTADRFVVFDNKAAQQIRDVGAFERYTTYLPEARRIIARYGDTEDAALALRAIARNDYQLIASNFFAPTEGRVSQLLFAQGYHFLDVRTGVISETYDDLVKATKSLSAAALRSSEGRLVGALRRGGAAAVGVGLVVLLASSASYAADANAGGGGTFDLGDVHFDIQATVALRAAAQTPTQQQFASAISTYASLQIKWALEDEYTAARTWGRGGDEGMGKEILNPFNFVLGGVLASSSVAAREGRRDVGEVVQIAEQSLTQLEAELAKNELTLADSERAAYRNRVLGIYGFTPVEAAAQVAGF
jgi:RHS repeat-associated protein